MLTNNSKHQHLSSQGDIQPGQDTEISSQEIITKVSQEIVIENGTRRKCKGLLGGTVPTAPPDRGQELENLRQKMIRIEKEISERYIREAETVPPTINKALRSF